MFAARSTAIVIALACAGIAMAQTSAPRVPPGAKVIRDLEYAQVGGKQLLLDLYLPEVIERPVPVIVAIHGGGWAAGSRADAQGIRLAGRGYAVAAIAYRLSGEATFPAQIEDCKAAVRWLRAQAAKYQIDPDHFGAIGHSAGGHLASLLGTAGGAGEFDRGDHLDRSSRVQAVCALSGPTDFLEMDRHAVEGARLKHDFPGSPESRLVGGPIQENPDRVRKANPITYISKDTPPFLLIHGDRDPLVPAHQAELLRAALEKAGVPVRLHLVKGAGHGVGGREVDELVNGFFDEHLKGLKTSEGGDAAASGRPGAGSGSRVPDPAAPTELKPPAGLFVCRGPSPTPPREVDFPFIDGWLVRPGWDRIEPSEGAFDWTYIDNEIALAKQLKKKLALAVLGGPQTPGWVYAAGAQGFSYTMAIGRRRAWQLIASFSRTPGQFPQDGLKAAIEQGMSWNGHYFEVWETDAMNETLHPLLEQLSARLKQE